MRQKVMGEGGAMNTDRVLCEVRSTAERVEILALFYWAARALPIRAAILYHITLEFVKRKKQICAICTVFLKLFVQNDDIKKNVKILLLKLSCSGIMYT